MKRRTVKKELLNVLACPMCKGNVTLKSNGEESSGFLYCGKCDQAYPIEEGIPNILPLELRIPTDGHENNTSLSIKQANMGYGYRYYQEWDRNKWLNNPACICGKPPLIDFTLKYLNRPKMKVLDCCSGIGVTASLLTNRDLKLFCFDISHDSIAALVKHNTNLSNTFVADAENMPVRDNSFDAVLFSSALHHLPNPRKGLSESFRVLKKGGRVILTEPNSRRNSGITAEVIIIMLKLVLRPSLGVKDLIFTYDKAVAKILRRKVVRYDNKDYTLDSDGRWVALDETDQEISLPYVLRLAKMTGFKVLDARTQDFALALAKFLKKDISTKVWRKLQRIDKMLFERIPLLNRFGDHLLVALEK